MKGPISSSLGSSRRSCTMCAPSHEASPRSRVQRIFRWSTSPAECFPGRVSTSSRRSTGSSEQITTSASYPPSSTRCSNPSLRNSTPRSSSPSVRWYPDSCGITSHKEHGGSTSSSTTFPSPTLPSRQNSHTRSRRSRLLSRLHSEQLSSSTKLCRRSRVSSSRPRERPDQQSEQMPSLFLTPANH